MTVSINKRINWEKDVVTEKHKEKTVYQSTSFLQMYTYKEEVHRMVSY